MRQPQDQRADKKCVSRRNKIVKHDAPAIVAASVNGANGRWLDDVKKAKKPESNEFQQPFGHIPQRVQTGWI